MALPIALSATLLALAVDGDPSFARAQIVAVRDQGSAKELWAIRPNGGELQRIGETISAIGRPSWSLDGKHVLFTELAASQADLYSLPVSGGRKTLVSRQPGLNADADLAPDGSALALVLTRDGNSEIYKQERGVLTRLTREWTLDASPAWSPDSQKIAFISGRQGHNELFVMDRDGKDARALTSLAMSAEDPDWSPSGEQIVFAVRESAENADLWILDVASGEARKLTTTPGFDLEPSFSPCGRYVVFVSDRARARDLYIISLEDGATRALTKGGEFSSPAWSPLLADTANLAKRTKD